MHWKFEPIFSISVQHQHHLNGSPAASPDFALKPSAATAERLRHLNWIFKEQADGARIFAEQVVSPDGEATYARQPIEDEAFTFYLRLLNPALLGYTAPYMQAGANPAAPTAAAAAALDMRARAMMAKSTSIEKPIPNSALPPFSGVSRLLYFDNLSAVSIPQPNAPPDAPPLLRITAGAFVDTPEFASRGPTPFTLRHKPGSKQAEFTPASPSSTGARLFDIAPTAQSLTVTLPPNLYRLRQIPGDDIENIYLSDERLDSTIFGIIRIFNTSTLPTLSAQRHYSAVFAEV